MRAKFIGIDVGTSSCKGVLLDERGEILRIASAPYPLIRSPEGIEQAGKDLWEGVKQTVRVLMEGVDKEEVLSLGVTSQGITFLPVNGEGKPLSNAISWLDTRAVKELEIVRGRFSDEEIFLLTGKRLEAYYLLPKLLWLRSNKREIYEKAWKFLMVADFIMMKLSGEVVTDHTLAGGSLLYDVRENRWSERLLEAFDLPKGKFPSLRWAGEVVGYVRGEIARELGLGEKVRIVVAGQDQKCADFGAGLNEEGIAISLGTASAISTLVSRPLLDHKMRIPLFPYISPGEWVLEGVVATAGASYDWMKRILGRGLRDYEPKPQHLSSLPFFLPHLTGASSPLWDKEARGSFHNLSLSTGREDLLYAVLEGVSFEIRRNVEVLGELAGERKEVIIFGGGVRNKIWRLLLTNLLGRRVKHLRMTEAPALGSALLAGKAMGWKGVAKLRSEEMEPVEEWQEALEGRYRTYLFLQP